MKRLGKRIWSNISVETFDILEDHHLTQQAAVHHIQHLVQEAAISRKVTAQQVAAIRLIVQGLQLREVQKNV